jgi:hypothetical protein
MRAASWVIVDKATGRAVWETFDRELADKVKTASYRVVPIGEWLASLNRRNSN